MLCIKGYRYCLSPLIPARCRFYPTCSEYSLTAYQRFGLVKGTYLSVKRIARCHPWGGSGHDPVPEKPQECCDRSDSLD